MITERMPVITLWQPWATWVALGWKTIETRTHTRFSKLKGQQIAIHAAQYWDKDACSLAGVWMSRNDINRTLDYFTVRGSIVCTAKVINFRPLKEEDSRDALICCDPEKNRRFGLILREVKMIAPIPAKGRQGIWYYDIPRT